MSDKERDQGGKTDVGEVWSSGELRQRLTGLATIQSPEFCGSDRVERGGRTVENVDPPDGAR